MGVFLSNPFDAESCWCCWPATPRTCNPHTNTTANGSTTCTTTSTPGTPASTGVRSIPQAHVHAIMPDRTHITLWCQSGFRHCDTLAAGYYSAEVDRNSVRID